MPNITKFLRMLPMAAAWSTSGDDVAIYVSGYVRGIWMMSRFHIVSLHVYSLAARRYLNNRNYCTDYNQIFLNAKNKQVLIV